MPPVLFFLYNLCFQCKIVVGLSISQERTAEPCSDSLHGHKAGRGIAHVVYLKDPWEMKVILIHGCFLGFTVSNVPIISWSTLFLKNHLFLWLTTSSMICSFCLLCWSLLFIVRLQSICRWWFHLNIYMLVTSECSLFSSLPWPPCQWLALSLSFKLKCSSCLRS